MYQANMPCTNRLLVPWFDNGWSNQFAGNKSQTTHLVVSDSDPVTFPLEGWQPLLRCTWTCLRGVYRHWHALCVKVEICLCNRLIQRRRGLPSLLHCTLLSGMPLLANVTQLRFALAVWSSFVWCIFNTKLLIFRNLQLSTKTERQDSLTLWF